MKYNIAYQLFFFLDCAFGVISKKSSPYPISFRFSPMLSSRSLIVWCFIFRSVVHFELINYLFNLFIWLHCAACGILVPWPGIEPWPSAVKVWSPNPWTTREFPIFKNLFYWSIVDLYFELIFVKSLNYLPQFFFFFYKWTMSCCFSTICWKDYLCSIVLP